MGTYLIKPGELVLKGGNRKGFENILIRNLAALLKGSGAQIVQGNGRVLVRCGDGSERQVEDSLSRLMGISGWAKTRIIEKKIEAVLAACVEEARLLSDRGMRSFKVEARRTDKSFPYESYRMRCLAGDAVLSEFPGLRVDVKKPDAVIEIEIRDKAYVYGMTHDGRRGLPVGTAGRGLLLLSGGIDSPVAGYMIASRGMGLDAVYFHAYPYTSGVARGKAVSLAGIIGRYTQGIRLYVVSFTKVQNRIKDYTLERPEEMRMEAWRTLLLRMAMMECAEKLAVSRHAKCLVSGESLSQVASQTIENITCTQSRVKLPVLRPLIGMNKEEIIARAKEIGTYETSILPYEDCCILFSPEHPVLRGDPALAGKYYDELGVTPLIDEALREAEIEKCSFTV